MFQIGDKVVYGIHGVCSVTGLEERLVDRKKVTYLVLEPMGQGSSLFLVPAHNHAAMSKLKPILTPQELETLIQSDAVRMDGWIPDDGKRRHTYREWLNSGDRTRILCMMRSLYRHREIQLAAGKRCHISDENYLRDAEKLMAGEFGLVLGMNAEQAVHYVRNHLQAD